MQAEGDRPTGQIHPLAPDPHPRLAPAWGKRVTIPEDFSITLGRKDGGRSLEHYCRDLSGWPVHGWGWKTDLTLGEQLLTLFRPFLEHLAASDLSQKTIQKHFDNMWALGGEFIRDLHSDPSLRKKPVEQILLQDDRATAARSSITGRRSAKILRFHLPEVPAVPQRAGSLTLAVTHNFP